MPDVEKRLQNALRVRLAPKTANALLTTLTSIFDRAVRVGYVEQNPAAKVERLRASAAELRDGEPAAASGDREVDRKDVPSPDEVKRLLLAAEPACTTRFSSPPRSRALAPVNSSP